MPRKSVQDAEAAKSVGIWIRVSTDDQARGDSPAVHEKRARLYAEARGWSVVTVYHLEGVSGKGVSHHPETKRMLADMRAKRIGGLIFSKLARLARNTKELLEFSDEFKKHDADLISLQEAIDTSSPAGRLFYTIIAAMAQWEREEIASRVAASVPIRAKMGKLMGGKTPYGYKAENGKLVLNPKEAPVRKLIYELFLEHKRQLTVAKILNERGYRTSKGAKFTRQTVVRMLQDPTAKGTQRLNYSTWTDGKIVLKPESEWVMRDIEPIVSAEVWDEANALLAKQKLTGSNIGRRAVHLFAGFTVCHCGQKMYVPSNNPRYRCWKCDNRIPVADLEAIYHGELKGYLFSEEQLAKHREQTDADLREREERVGHLAQEAERVRREMDKVYQLYLADEISKDGFGNRYRPLEERAKALENELPTAQAALDVLRIHHLSHDTVVREARDLHARWPELSHSEKRAIVEAITRRITIGTDTVEIDLHYAPDKPPREEGEGGNSLASSSAYAASRNSDKKGTFQSA
ncbi:MAG: recombinase family protein [Alphaproteobacteria bacterium]|nr:recombinase family protein [Alphaproteobacteria bacterium]MBL7098755.1 recombinase family protein [Alphaproteobacteria bacterium]